jgi:cytochrome c oxidase cbb3-type subunit 1
MELSGLGVPILVALSFALSVIGLYVFIVALAQSLWAPDEGRVSSFLRAKRRSRRAGSGRAEVAGLRAAMHGREARGSEFADRIAADRSSALATFIFLMLGVLWLVIGSFAGLIASLRLHMPDWLAAYAPLTFGRVRVAHLNMVVYGWASMTEMGIAVWLLPRMLRTELVGASYAIAGAAFWNSGLLLGVVAILFGWNDGLEYLEIPWPIAPLFVIGGALTAIPLFLTLAQRRVKHLYVSVWYIGAALVWFPILFLVAKLPVHFGGAGDDELVVRAQRACLLDDAARARCGLITCAESARQADLLVHLSLIAFWAQALFYGQAGVHHLIEARCRPGW